MVKFLVYNLALLILPTLIQAQRSYSIEFTSYHHEVNSNFYKLMNIELIKMPNHNALNGCLAFTKDIENFDIGFRANIPRKGTSIPWTALNVTVDGCKIIESASKKSMKFFYELFVSIKKMYTNFPNKCPLQKNKEFCLTNFYLDSIDFPPNIPDTNVDIRFDMLQRNTIMFRGYFGVAIRGRRKL